jgi:sodium-independent sulfate anion transporter 11
MYPPKWLSPSLLTLNSQIVTYLLSLFPIISWAPRYSTPDLLSCLFTPTHDVHLDLGWLTGDVIAGLTVGLVVVPQGMSYAQVYQTCSYC